MSINGVAEFSLPASLKVLSMSGTSSCASGLKDVPCWPLTDAQRAFKRSDQLTWALPGASKSNVSIEATLDALLFLAKGFSDLSISSSYAGAATRAFTAEHGMREQARSSATQSMALADSCGNQMQYPQANLHSPYAGFTYPRPCSYAWREYLTHMIENVVIRPAVHLRFLAFWLQLFH